MGLDVSCRYNLNVFQSCAALTIDAYKYLPCLRGTRSTALWNIKEMDSVCPIDQ